MSRDPADVSHAPVDVLRVDILDEIRSAGDVGEVAAGAVLAPFRLAGGAARVHQEEWIVGEHFLRGDPAAAVSLQEVVDDEIASPHERRRAGIAAGVALPDEDLVD